ncbi:hypothetical protein QFZ77_007490 [Paenibacillus sp. V4I3]|uniref:hypothetical protein n=1 Tax=Paenibacillus sp. V4I3 TaxID=3042305 RepID=UPI002785F5D7|nr:hypothetical protein [Paenibacillus sp. V4I3]MDQ0878831.1 hypothetical protein [Paenibacillus sp. V4I3]
MSKKLMSILVLSIAAILSVQLAIAHPHDEATKGKDSIEWIAFWEFPQTREEQLERMLTTELQRRTLFALEENKYLKPGKEYLYSFEPFKVTNMRTVDGGFSELDVTASVHRVINNDIEKKAEKFQITFRHNYDLGFVVTECNRITEKNDGQ